MVRTDTSYKSETIAVYEQYTAEFDKKFGEHFQSRVQKHADRFLAYLVGPKILDLGSGPGHHAQYFHDYGKDVLCIDLSEKMVTLCKQKGLAAHVMDMENMTLPDAHFDGIWAYTSLPHIPKNRIPPLLTTICRILKPSGIVGLSLKEGHNEGFEQYGPYRSAHRWFSYYTDDEIRALIEPSFTVLYASREPTKKSVFLNYLLQVNNSKS